jgi:hypothetical protein
VAEEAGSPERRPPVRTLSARAFRKPYMILYLRRVAFLAAAFLPCLSAPALAAMESFDVRLSPGPRLVGTRADSSGGGHFSVRLNGSTLQLEGSYQGLLGVPTSARLLMGSAPGVRGPKVADLTVSPHADGELRGVVKLDGERLAAFRKGGLYVEIDSAEAPEGDLWGWIMPPAE